MIDQWELQSLYLTPMPPSGQYETVTEWNSYTSVLESLNTIQKSKKCCDLMGDIYIYILLCSSIRVNTTFYQYFLPPKLAACASPGFSARGRFCAGASFLLSLLPTLLCCLFHLLLKHLLFLRWPAASPSHTFRQSDERVLLIFLLRVSTSISSNRSNKIHSWTQQYRRKYMHYLVAIHWTTVSRLLIQCMDF